MMKNFVTSLSVMWFVLVLAMPAAGIPVWGSDAGGADLDTITNGLTRNLDGGLSTNISSETPFDVMLDWNVYQDAGNPGLWHYDYTWSWTNENVSNSISHFILEITQTEDPNDFLIQSISPGDYEGPDTFSPPTNPNANNAGGNPGLPADIYGVKFDSMGDSIDDNTVMYSLVTNRMPVWGVVYGKFGSAGVWSSALNEADFRTSETLDTTLFAVRPDGASVPIPGAIWLLGSGLLGLVGLRRFRKE